jgi:predicted ester cyclase
MSRRIFALVLIAALGACSAQSADTSTRSPEMDNSAAEKNKQTVRRIYEEYVNQARPELLPELIAADYVAPDGQRGHAAYGSVVDGLRRGVPDIRFKVEDLIAEGDRVAIRWTWSGKHTGTLNGLSPSNRHVKNDGIAIYELRGGKVSKVWLQTDRLGFLQQIGVVDPALGRAPSRP